MGVNAEQNAVRQRNEQFEKIAVLGRV